MFRWILILLISSTLLTGCISTDAQIEEDQIFTAVSMIAVDEKEVVEKIEALGEIESKDRYKVSINTSSTIEEINYNTGEFVKKGDILFILNSKEF
ncbi:MAG: biotin/lipoyl-binding protein [Clostridiales bacterium]|nr:biotin/lipoyl-binding protein [Clostridiales bacterium]